jgi:hypothetical protein
MRKNKPKCAFIDVIHDKGGKTKNKDQSKDTPSESLELISIGTSF